MTDSIEKIQSYRWPQLAPVNRYEEAMHRCAGYLSMQLCQPQQPLHTYLSNLYGSDDMAQAEIDRSLAVLRGLKASPELPGGLRGKLVVMLPAQQPLYALVSQVLLPATVYKQVRATTVFGPMQSASRAIFTWLAHSVGSHIQAAADCSTQLWQGNVLGSMMLAHPDQQGAGVRKGLSLISCPDAVLSTSPIWQGRALSHQLQGCSVLMPQSLATCAVVSDQTAAQLRLTMRSIADGVEQQFYRHGGIFDVLLVQDAVADRVEAGLRQVVRSQMHLCDRWLRPSDRLDNLAANAMPPQAQQQPFVALLRYHSDADLGFFIADLVKQPAQLSIFGTSPTAMSAMPLDRLHLGQTPAAAEDLAARHGIAQPVGLCEVRGHQVEIARFDLMARLRLAVMPQVGSAAAHIAPVLPSSPKRR